MPNNTHFLSVLPLDWSRVEVQEIHKLFAKMYYREDDVIRLIQRSEMPVEEIKWGTSMLTAWHDIMEKAQDRGKLRTVIEAILSDSSKSEYRNRILELVADKPVVAIANDENIDWRPDEIKDSDQLERIIGQRSNLLDISFLKEGLRVSKAVARITVAFSDGTYYGTGFLIKENCILTNHHVLFNHAARDEKASSVDIRFDYERGELGGLSPIYEVQGVVGSIIGDKQHDWAIINTMEQVDGQYPCLKLGGKMPSMDDRVYIIQHPNGAVKQIGMHNNIVRYVDNKVVQYWTDTEGGSSGSPVFNSKWEVVALHQGWEVAGTVFRKEYRNQGINIDRVIEGLKSYGINL